MAGRPGGRARKEAANAAEKAALAQAPPTTPKRRRKPKSEIPTTQDARVEEIVFMMLKHKWDPREAPFELAQLWGCSLNTIVKAADRAGVRITTATGNLERQVAQCLGELDEIKKDAMAEKQFSAAVRAVELKLKVAGALRTKPLHVPNEDTRNPQGLPPELAKLNPEPSIEEVKHFAATERADDCTLEGCRIHPKTQTASTEQLH